jgi:5-(carboxyamino)imidazole ribonucleotide mutase
MPPGIPLATMPENGAKNAALLAVEILSLSDPALATKYDTFRKQQHGNVISIDKKLQEVGWKQYLKERK